MAETISMPKLGFDMAEGTLVHWVKKIGEEIGQGDVLAEIETDKATVEVESPAGGVVRLHLVDEGMVVPVGTPIAVVGTADEDVSAMDVRPNESAVPVGDAGGEPESASSMGAPPPVTPDINYGDRRIKASPLAKKIARDKEVDLSAIEGTGPGGRIVRRDIEEAYSAVGRPAAQTESVQPEVIKKPQDKIVTLTRLRQAIGRRLADSKQQAPHFYLTHDYKMDALMALRKQVNGMLPDGEKLSVNDFILKATALALREFPNLNASLDGDTIVQHGQINVGVAVTVPGGLMTVIVKDTDQKSLRQISQEVKSMAERARGGKVKPDDVEGSTFSTSNLGMYDVDEFIAIINPPEAAILAIGSAQQVPVAAEGEIAIGWRMKATISVDHRVSDGAEAAQFMQALAKYLEEPLRLMV